MTKRVAWFTGEPSIKDWFTPHKVYEVVREGDTNFSVINDKGVQNFCLKKGCAHICHNDWVLADIVEERVKVETIVKPKKSKKWSDWLPNITGNNPVGLSYGQKVKVKWDDGDVFEDFAGITAWYISKDAPNITHYKVKLKDVSEDTPKVQEKPKGKWTKNTGVCPVDSDVDVEIKMKNGDKECALAKHFSWGFDDQEYDIIKWRLAD